MQKTDSKSDRDKQVQVRLPASLHKQLKLALIQDDSSLADFFNEAAMAYLKDPDKYKKAIGHPTQARAAESSSLHRKSLNC